MNIKEKIGKRIASSRKEAGLTIKELADKTKSLKAARIGNWEQGSRTPGPSEILQLAKVLKVDPAYLLCLSDLKNSHSFEKQLIPILSLKDAIKFEKYIANDFSDSIEKFDHLIADQSNHSCSFAIKIDDQSMLPEFSLGDIVMIDAQSNPMPGNYVLVYLVDQDKALLRKYRLINNSSSKKPTFELIPLNSDWPTLLIKNNEHCRILGVCVEQRRYR